jgi:hypothetical protein
LLSWGYQNKNRRIYISWRRGFDWCMCVVVLVCAHTLHHLTNQSIPTHTRSKQKTHTHKYSVFQMRLTKQSPTKNPPPNYGCRWLQQRVAMDDLASYFVEERSKVR